MPAVSHELASNTISHHHARRTSRPPIDSDSPTLRSSRATALSSNRATATRQILRHPGVVDSCLQAFGLWIGAGSFLPATTSPRVLFVTAEHLFIHHLHHWERLCIAIRGLYPIYCISATSAAFPSAASRFYDSPPRLHHTAFTRSAVISSIALCSRTACTFRKKHPKNRCLAIYLSRPRLSLTSTASFELQ